MGQGREASEGRTGLLSNELHKLHSAPSVVRAMTATRRVITDDEMSKACSRHGRDENCMQGFGRKTWKDESSWET